MHRPFLALFLGLLPATLAHPLMAQQTPPAATPSAILVVDGSGSMWGQIDGINKIVIAREVVADLLADLPDDLSLGLTVYGHRRRGDCSDIETMIAPGRGNRAAIRAAVDAINPRGRTPMTRAVVEAAEALRYTEDAATVILVSDGIETCEADPCAIAAQLEAAGIDFTAHVVGFDVASEPEARAQMQCIADNTGGRFLTADNAEELAAALHEVAATVVAPPAPQPTPAPAPEPVAITQRVGFSAMLRRGTAVVALDAGVVYEVVQGDTIVMDATEAPRAEATLPEGDYVLRAYRLTSEEQIEQPFTVSGSGDQSVEVVFTEALPLATLSAPASGATGETLSITWEGPNGQGDFLSTVAAGAAALDYLTYAYTMDGMPLDLRLPAQPGDYVIRYVMAEGAQVLAEVPVSVTDRQQALTLPATAPIGTTIQVGWQGAGHNDDYLDTALPGAEPGAYISYAYVRDGNPVGLRLPVFPGTYDVRYITGQDMTVFARATIEVTDIPASLSAPASAAAGSTLSVAWQGPANPLDYLTIALPEDGALGYASYAYVEGGTPLAIEVPTTPGTYELRYIADGPEARIMARQSLVVN